MRTPASPQKKALRITHNASKVDTVKLILKNSAKVKSD
jgi:hypothetical protein